MLLAGHHAGQAAADGRVRSIIYGLMDPAPIAVFAYNRPEHTRRLFESLLANPEITDSRVYVYSDGPRHPSDARLVEATRASIRAVPIRRLEVIERPANLGLAPNVIQGVHDVCAAHGRVIVLEDDLHVSPTFLAFMNDALERYRDSTAVMHVSGYMFPMRPTGGADVLFLPFVNVSGWATWDRAWRHFDADAGGYQQLVNDPALRRKFDLDDHYYFFEMLEAYRQGRIQSWAIRWYLSMFTSGGLAVYPARSLVENRGYDGAATNTHDREPPPHGRSKAQAFRAVTFSDPAVDPDVFRRVKRLLARERSFPRRARNKLRYIWRQMLARPGAHAAR